MPRVQVTGKFDFNVFELTRLYCISNLLQGNTLPGILGGHLQEVQLCSLTLKC